MFTGYCNPCYIIYRDDYRKGEYRIMSKKVGYMRISTTKEEQTFDRQEAQLLEAGVEKIYADRMSGAKFDRPALHQMLDELEAGDTIMIVGIDRLSRSARDLLEIVDIIKNKGAFLKSINDSWLDTTDSSPMAEFLLTVMGGLAQMERAMITQRVKEGVAVAKQKGVKFGRPKANSNKVAYALELYNKGEHTVKQICDITGISKATLYRKIKEQEEALV
jgi:DNA invertase Pin-like site-specific DNA recombinase